jgi:hypothetical protein
LKRIPPYARFADGQSGGAMLSVVATIGFVLLVTQGTGYYRSRASAKLLSQEKNKVLAMQMAEAGVEENIADLGKRILRVSGDMAEVVTYENKPLEGGSYTSMFTTVATGPSADTIDLTSIGTVGTGSSQVQARLRLKKFMDTTRTIVMYADPETTLTLATRTVPVTTTVTTPPMDPSSMPALDMTPAYAACMGSSEKKCDVCHLPGGDISRKHTINISKSSVNTHISHHGDYVTTDGSCDLYESRTVTTVTYHLVTDTTRVITDNTTYDTTIAIDTAVKVQILSWK